ncbi:MAG: DNA polymerase III subunit beta [Desulfobulbaceae bacterium]|nr:DNA polymerase III subunit beta [Desulfobulbaceae bacterium]
MGLHCTVHRDDLLKAVNAQQNITNKKGSMAILSNLLLEAADNQLTCTGTDLEIGLKQTIAAEVVEPGCITLPAKKLFELARESGSADILIKEQDNAWVSIEAGPSNYRLAGMDPQEFPQFPPYNQEALLSLDSEILAEMIDKTSFSIALDKESIFSLTAALLQKHEEQGKFFLKMITSDGHRLTTMAREVDEGLSKMEIPPSTLIPRRGIQEIRKFCENRDSFLFSVEEKQVVLKSETSLLIIRLMKGDFPDFASVIKNISHENEVQINRVRFLEGLKRMNLFTEDIFHAIKISLAENTMILNSQHAEYGSATDSFAVQYTGDTVELAFNCRFFIDTVQVMEGDIIKATIQNKKSPCMITSEQDAGFLSVIMPMKL